MIHILNTGCSLGSNPTSREVSLGLLGMFNTSTSIYFQHFQYNEPKNIQKLLHIVSRGSLNPLISPKIVLLEMAHKTNQDFDYYLAKHSCKMKKKKKLNYSICAQLRDFKDTCTLKIIQNDAYSGLLKVHNGYQLYSQCQTRVYFDLCIYMTINRVVTQMLKQPHVAL